MLEEAMNKLFVFSNFFNLSVSSISPADYYKGIRNFFCVSINHISYFKISTILKHFGYIEPMQYCLPLGGKVADEQKDGHRVSNDLLDV